MKRRKARKRPELLNWNWRYQCELMFVLYISMGRYIKT